MAGGIYVAICVGFALAAGIIGRIKGSSFVLWFLIGGFLPVLGLIAAVLYRYETEELRRTCPRCGRVCMLYDAICVRCGHELEFPDQALESVSDAVAAERGRPAGA